jgi:hypothetical protein
MRKMSLIILPILLAGRAFGWGSDYPSDRPVSPQPGWPAGLANLVNSTNRVHGYFVNADDFFFYAGNAQAFAAFLAAYAQLSGIEAHKLHIHAGAGRAKSPWDKSEGKPCDWMLEMGSRSWRDAKAPPPGQTDARIVELHVWPAGKIDLQKLAIPKNVDVVREDNKVVP